MNKSWHKKIFSIKSDDDFNQCSVEAFQYQYINNEVYNEYCDRLNKQPQNVTHYSQIPFLPIRFFKTHKVLNKGKQSEIAFSSSGTTGMQTSKHFIADVSLYEKSFLRGFQLFYGDTKDYCVLALLPSYLERDGSSLIYMVKNLIERSQFSESGFYLNNYTDLANTLKGLEKLNRKTILFGVTYALLDLAEKHSLNLPNTIIMETGGMKGRRKEIVREELHNVLCEGLGVNKIHSEYGMTELLSQAYSKGDGVFYTPNWMKVLVRDTYDPFHYLPKEQGGAINVIDLANINSCCFIETSDLGKTFEKGGFSVLGRFDNSEIRGCNLMVGE